jgi:hypothetical protein
MYNPQLNKMSDHPVKVFMSVLTGLAVGSHSLLSTHPKMSITALSLQASIDLAIACGKAFLVGGAAYIGQTVAGHYRKKIVQWWKHRKAKKDETP